MKHQLILSDFGVPAKVQGNPLAAGVLLEKNIGVGYGKLRAKLLVFDSSKNLRHFWKRGMHRGELGFGALGAVSPMIRHVESYTKGAKEPRWHIEADSRYFCIVGLVAGALSMEIVSHEAVHAGFAFARRQSRAPWAEHIDRLDEEAVCYPAGRIAKAINRELHRAGLYDWKAGEKA